MKKYKFDVVNNDFYIEKLSNGLTLYMVPNNKSKNIMASLVAKYGSIHNEYKIANEKEYTKTLSGIAHFLEHQMFNNDSEETIDHLFKKNGASSNAYTSYCQTGYYFTTSEKLSANLNTLLKLVFDLTITDKTVSKEKGIIEQELKMMSDNPHIVLWQKAYESVFINDPTRIAIGGTLDDVNHITKKDLEQCYHTFYHPSNIFLVITGNFNPQTVVKTLKLGLTKHKFSKINKIKHKKVIEPASIAIPYVEKEMLVEIPKLAFNIKIPIKKYKSNFSDQAIIDYLGIVFDSLFDNTTLLNEELRIKKLITGKLKLRYFLSGDYMIVTIYCETNHKDKVISRIKETLANIKVTAKEFSMQQHSLISNSIKLFDKVESLNSHLVDVVIEYHKIDPKFITKLKNFNTKDMKKIMSKLDLSNYTVVYIKNKD